MRGCVGTTGAYNYCVQLNGEMPGYGSGAEEEKLYEGICFRVHVPMTRHLLEDVALMPQDKLNLSQCVAFLTDAPEIEAIHKIKSACCFCYEYS